MTSQPVASDRLRSLMEKAKARSLPAWLLSVLVHLLALIILALVVRGLPKSLPGQPDRPVAVVLAHRGPDQKVQYFDEQDHDAAARAQEVSPSAEPLLPAATADQSLLLTDLALPNRPERPIGASLSDQLVHVPSMKAIGRRPIFPGEGDEEILAEEAARRRNRGGPVGPGAKLAVFGTGAARGHTFVFVIDRSKSMGSSGLGALDAAAKELLRALSQLKPNHQFQIIAYHHKPMYVLDTRKMLPATAENIHEVPPYFATMAAFGATAHETALLAALRLKPDVIFWLTDGGDPYLNELQLDRITSRAGGRTSIHCVQFGLGPLQQEDNFMMELARRNRGTYSYVDMSGGPAGLHRRP